MDWKGYSISEGTALVKAARNAMELSLVSPGFDGAAVEGVLGEYSEKAGVFVTIAHHPTDTVRGCTGSAWPRERLGRALVQSAIAASEGRGKFIPMAHGELQDVTVEVSIIRNLEKIRRKTPLGRKNAIRVGKDGIFVEYGFNSAAVMPTAALKSDADVGSLLSGLCEQVGLHASAWERPDISLYKFTAQVFKETEPEGEVTEVRL